MSVRTYLYNVLLGVDCLVSAILLGQPGETLSGRAGSALKQGKFRGQFWAPIIDWLMRKKGHCLAAVEGDVLRARAVIVDQTR